jgi:hypothetical protein
MNNWRTSIPGIISLVSGMAVIYFAAVMIPQEAMGPELRTTIIFIGIGLMGGGGLVAARDNAQSQRVAQRLESQIDRASEQAKVEAKREAVAEVKAHVVNVAKDVAKDTATVVVEEERRKGL